MKRIIMFALLFTCMSGYSYAATSPGRSGPEAKSAVPELTRIKDGDTNSVVGRAAAEALDRINNTLVPASAKPAPAKTMGSLYRVPVIVLGI